MLPSTERRYISKSPFVYHDQRRTFVVIPRGTYTGGYSDPDLGLAFEMDTSPIPLDLPDAVAHTVAEFIATSSPTRRAADEQTTDIAPAPGMAMMLSPVALLPTALGPFQWEAKHFRYENHYHPFVCLLIEELNRYGIDGILKPNPEKEKDPQRKAIVKSLHRQKRTRTFFEGAYNPTSVVDQPRPVEKFDFAYGTSYSVYNWELYFHAPLMLAQRLSANQRFAEAKRWFEYIFEPTYQPQEPLSEPWPDRVWQMKRFFEYGQGESIQRTMLLLKSSGLTAAEQAERKNLRDQIEAWRKDPFNPHLIARMRPQAYMMATVMAYLDNLIAWGDHLFQQDTIETINEATQLYILAAEILGERPQEIPAHEDSIPTIDGEHVATFNDLRGRLDEFSNVLIELETWIETDTTPSGGSIGSLIGNTDLTFGGNGDGGDPPLGLSLVSNNFEPPTDNPPVVALPLADPRPAVLGPTLFFCIPKNDRLLGYWDTVEDRLFKIRHCMNIEGVVRQLPLFQPPIDPGLLVKAAAAGVDISSALSALNAPLPYYRFQVIQQKAQELINDVKSLGAALLSALEKRDAEELALLRASHETRVLDSVRQVKERSIEEAQANLAALQVSRRAAQFRHAYYDSRPRTNAKEDEHLSKLEDAHIAQLAGQIIEVIRGTLSALPNFDIGVAGISSPVVKASWGGSNLASILDAASKGASIAATVYSYQANKASIGAGYDRREDDWKFQAEAANIEVTQIEAQIAASEVRIALAEKDLASHEVQIENAKATEAYLRGKYTNPELYSWMIGQTAGIYFQSYQLAYDLAQRAERAFRHELGLESSSYIQFGYWDNLKQGLLAGERLQADLRRLEIAYLEGNRREYELTKHVSLVMLNPEALIELRATGCCEFELPEALFDLDYAGHYFRRIQTISLSIPTVTGPYTTVSCTLRLLHSSVRWQSSLLNGDYARDLDNDDPRFRETFGAIQSIATSSGRNDSGLFELNFRDERFLPFEGLGVISRWQLEMPTEFRQFDYDSISDVVVHVRYTAREGGGALHEAATQHLRDAINSLVIGTNAPGLYQPISARHEFPTEFHRLLHPAAEAETQLLTLNLTQQHFPYMFRNRGITVDHVSVFVQLADAFIQADGSGTEFVLTHPGGETNIDLGTATTLGNLRQIAIDDMDSMPGEWTLTVSAVGSSLADESERLNPDAVKNIIFALHFTITAENA